MTVYTGCGHAIVRAYESYKKRSGRCPICTGEAKHMPLPTWRRKRNPNRERIQT